MLVPRMLLAAALAAVAILGSVALLGRPEPAPRPVTAAATPDSADPAPRTAEGDPRPPAPDEPDASEPKFTIPANARQHESIPDEWRKGIGCPDGSVLPLLNGVPYARPVNRDPDQGPLPPVVEIVKDAGGYDWYRHEDGSYTTARWVPMRIQSGDDVVDVSEVVTSHVVPMPGEPTELLRGAPDSDGDVPIGAGPRQPPVGPGSGPPSTSGGAGR